MKNTIFQSKLIEDKECLWDLVKLFHPNIPNTVESNKGIMLSVKDKVIASSKYTWVNISFKVRGYGLIDFAVDNKTNHTLMGNRVTKKDMQEAINNEQVTISGWRTCLDKVYVEDPNLSDENRDGLSFLVSRTLALHGYSIITIPEWYESYYED
jgi:hypothetical protein